MWIANTALENPDRTSNDRLATRVLIHDRVKIEFGMVEKWIIKKYSLNL